jgi:hypothetical protein
LRLVQLIRFLGVKLTHIGLNFRFDISVIFTANYFFSRRGRPDNSDVFLVIDFVNLKIKSTQSFRCAHSDRVYVHIFIWMNARTYICITIFKKVVTSLI